MRRVMLGTVKFLGNDTPLADLIGAFIKPLPHGSSLDTMRLRVKVADKLSKAVTENAAFIDLEDAEWGEVRNAVNSPPFNICDAGVLAAADAVLDAKDPPVVTEAKDDK
jgi:hypothetical protein